MSANRVAILVLTIGSFVGCSAHSSSPIAKTGPTRFSNNLNAEDFGEVAIVPDDNDVVSGYEESRPDRKCTSAYPEHIATNDPIVNNQLLIRQTSSVFQMLSRLTTPIPPNQRAIKTL